MEGPRCGACLLAYVSVFRILAVLLYFLPNMAAWQLQRSMGSRAAEQIAEQVPREDINALFALSKPAILVDIPLCGNMTIGF